MRQAFTLWAVAVITPWTGSGFLPQTARLTSRTRCSTWAPRSERDESAQEHKVDSTVASSAPTQQKEGCPFSMVFPRFRIHLRSVESPQQKSFSLPLLGGIQASLTRSKFEQSAIRGEPHRWIEGTDGISAFATLWRQVAELTNREEPMDTALLGLPDCEVRVVQNFLDILAWIGRNVEGVPIVDYEILNEQSAFPVVRLRRTHSMVEAPSEDYAPIDASVVERRLQAWVKRILVDQSICPFTKSTSKSGQGLSDVGVPVGRISYCTSHGTRNDLYRLMADTWEAIDAMIVAGPSGKDGVSSILLAAPAFDGDFAFWAGPVFAILEAGVIAAGAEKSIGIVCFHPLYATPDGSSWPGFGHMHSVPRLQKWLLEHDPSQDLGVDEVAAGGAWQRRTPHATINVLRADQLEAAEGRRASRLLYTENIRKLVGKPDGIGSPKLMQDLKRERHLT